MRASRSRRKGAERVYEREGDTYVVVYMSDSQCAKLICFIRHLRVRGMHSTMWLWSTLYDSRCVLGSLSSVTI